jgi:isocitrate dehydrogenase kinase/phosphatase
MPTTPPALSDSRLSNLGAMSILRAFEDYADRWMIVTRRARIRFQQRDWAGMQKDTSERLSLYGQAVRPAVDEIRSLLGARVQDPMLWAGMKAVYSGLIMARDDWEVAETFFNSITRKVFDTVGVNPQIEFVDTDFEVPPLAAGTTVIRTYERTSDLEGLVTSILEDADLGVEFVDLASDAASVAARVRDRLHEASALPSVERAEVLDMVFHRGSAAYVVGRILSASEQFPLVLAVEHREDGAEVDAVLLHENEVSILFSFTRSYFHVDAPRPYDVVRFLRRLMPRKRTAELYISIGSNKHGKTELYRDLLRYLKGSTDKFEVARGKKGLVMAVFGLPGHVDVFKVIRDRPGYPKTITRQEVMDKYSLVFQHERGGRLMDVQSFEHLSFPVERFDDELLAELTGECGETVRIEGDEVVIEHLYVERRVIPLDIYVREASPLHARAAVVDFGRSIKDLASNDVFPGDLLLKNFGVTRHGRVVFYDYDDLTTLRSINFRHMPAPRSFEDELSSEPWFQVGPDDIFPEELKRFLGLTGDLRDAFLEVHGDLFEEEWWHAMQATLEAGTHIPIYPYEATARL